MKKVSDARSSPKNINPIARSIIDRKYLLAYIDRCFADAQKTVFDFIIKIFARLKAMIGQMPIGIAPNKRASEYD